MLLRACLGWRGDGKGRLGLVHQPLVGSSQALRAVEPASRSRAAFQGQKLPVPNCRVGLGGKRFWTKTFAAPYYESFVRGGWAVGSLNPKP